MSTFLFPDQTGDPDPRAHVRSSTSNFETSDTLLLGSMPNFQDFTMSDSAINLAFDMLAGHAHSTTVSTPSAGFHNPVAHSTPLNQQRAVYCESEDGMDFAIEAPNQKANMSAIDLSFLCRDLGIKEGPDTRLEAKDPETGHRQGRDRAQMSHDQSMRVHEIISQVELNRKKGRYWYSKYKAAESSRQLLEKRVKRHEAEAEKSEFQAIGKVMKEWELEFRRSRELMKRANHSIEKSFRILKESVLGTHMQDNESESRGAYGQECGEKTELKRRPIEVPSVSMVYPNRSPRASENREPEAHRRKSSSNLMLKDTPDPTKSRSSRRSESSLTSGSRQSSNPVIRHAKDQAVLYKKYMNVVKDKRDSTSKDQHDSAKAGTRIKCSSSRSRTEESSVRSPSSNTKGKNKEPTGGH